MLLSLEPWAINQRKIIKGKRHIKKGGKIKGGTHHVRWLLPPIHYIPQVWAFPLLATLIPQHVTHGCPFSFPTPFISLSHATTLWRTYLGHIIPFKSWNHLIGYFVNSIWSLETLAHDKAHYGRACYYEMPTRCPWFVSSLTWFPLMTCCTRRLGDVLDLMQNCRWSPFWLWSPYMGS